MPHEVLDELRRALAAAASPAVAVAFQRYVPVPVAALGVANGLIAEIAKQAVRRHTGLGAEQWLTLGSHFAQDHRWHEHLMLASALAAQMAPGVDDDGALLGRIGGWIEQDVGNWAQCDDLCIKPLYAYLRRHPHLQKRLPDWGASPSAWRRRASNVGLVKFVGRSDGVDPEPILEPILANCARLLPDPDTYVQKGVGWMLKVASQRAPAPVEDFLRRHRGGMDRATLRYAIEKLPPALRRSLLA